MIKVKGKMLKTAALTAAIMLSVAAAPVVQNGGVQTPQITAFAYEETDFNYTTVEYNGVSYAKYTDHVEAKGLTDSNRSASSVVIPSTVDGLPVTAIARNGFTCCQNLSSITFPSSIKTIGYYSFGFCDALVSVTLPSGLDTMEMHAFECCSNLSTVVFPNKLVKIHDRCFEYTPWMKAKKAESKLVTVNGALIYAQEASGDITLSSDIKYVSPGAFSRNSNITSVVFPAGVTELCDSTFYMCDNLRTVELPGVTKICNMALGGCKSLRDLKLSGKLTKIEDYAFMDTENTCSVTFYGDQNAWGRVEKPDCTFLKNANMVYDTSHTDPEPQPQTDLYPVVKTQVKNHKIGFKWNAVEGAEKYGIGVYQANKWVVKKQVDASVHTWTSPQVANGTYRLVVLAKVNGDWVKADVFKHAFYVTVS